MKFQFLGTAAAEGIPALFCNCERCARSREIGGRALRTRSQAIIDGTLLIDFPADTLAHTYHNNIDLLNVSACLVTHTHEDHLYPSDLVNLRPGFAHMPEGWHMSFYGSEKVGAKILPMLQGKILDMDVASFHTLAPYETVEVGRYTVTALPGHHAPYSGPLFYQISDGEKTVLYAHDTHYFFDEVWNFFEKTKPHFDLVSLDCTNATLPLTYVGHMGLAENAQVRARMLEMGLADEKTVFVCNHFSHNGTNVVYDDFVPLAAAEGFLVSYDGMILNI